MPFSLRCIRYTVTKYFTNAEIHVFVRYLFVVKKVLLLTDELPGHNVVSVTAATITVNFLIRSDQE